jgi:hypothetical protein
MKMGGFLFDVHGPITNVRRMNYPMQTSFMVSAATRVLPSLKKSFGTWLLLGLLLALCVARVQAQDDDYLAVYGIVEQADALKASGKTNRAYFKYLEAKQALVTLQQNYPGWNTATVNFRQKYLAENIAATAPPAAPTRVHVITPAPAAKAAVSAPSVSADPVAAPDAGGDGPSAVKLLNAGSEPRKVLRLHPKVGDHQTLSMTLKMNMGMSMGGNSLPAMNIPTTVMTANILVQDVSPAGEITYKMVYGTPTVAADASAMPAVVDAMKSAMAGLSGVSGIGKVSSNGAGKDLEMSVPDGASPQVIQSIGQMKGVFSSSSIIYPDEAIGVGAKWEYTAKLKSQGMSIDQTMDYEVVSIQGDQITLRGVIRQQAANQMIESPAMPGMKVNLTKMDGTSTANTTVNLGQVMPQTAMIDGTTDMSMGQGGQAMEMNMKMNVMMQGK